MKSIKSVSIIALIAICGVIGLFLTQSNKQPRTEKSSIKIGATLALTGNLAYIGESEKRGLEMAVEEINNHSGINGRTIELMIEDNQGDAKTAVASVNKLLADDSVNVIFSAFTHVTRAILESITQHNSVMIYASSVNDIARGNSQVFKDYFDNSYFARDIASILQHNKQKRVKLLTEISETCQQFEESLVREFNTRGIQLLQKESYEVASKDLKTHIQRLSAQRDFDAFVFCTWRHEDILMKQLKELDIITIPTYHVTAPVLPVADTSEMRALFSENKSISTWYGFAPNTSQVKQTEFIRKYRARYESDPRPDSAYAYDDVYAIADALNTCDAQNDLTSRCIARELTKTNLDGAGGPLSFDEHRASKRPIVLLQAEHNEWKEIPVPKE